MTPLIGTFLTIVGLYLSLRFWKKSRPELKVVVSQKSRYDSTFNRTIHFVHVSAINIGGGATTVNRLSFVGYRTKLHKWFNIHRVSVPIQAMKGFDVVKLPRKLTTGEEYETDILETVGNLEPLSGLLTWVAVGHTMSGKEVLVQFRFATNYDKI